MNKVMFIKANLTGRIFICVDTDSDYVETMSDHFTPGGHYREALLDSGGINDIKNGEQILLIVNKWGVALYVEEKSFILIEESIPGIALEPTCLN